MKKFLIAICFLSVMGIASGYAQNLDNPAEKLEAPTQMEDSSAQNPPSSSSEEQKYLAMGQNDASRGTERDPLADMIVATSTISAVTVYNNRAKVTRVAEVDLPAGKHTVAFEDLPATLLPDSLQASGAAEQAVKFGAIEHKVIMQKDLASARERDLFNKLQDLRDQRQPLIAERSALNAEAEFLKNIGRQATLRNNENLAQIDLKPDQWIAAAQAIHAGMADVLKATVEQNQKLRDLDRKIDQAQREFAQVATGEKSIFTVMVPLETESATKLRMEISYQVPNATWQPIYEARVNTEGKTDMQLTQYGSVRQQTGEDWNGVALTLSTAQPQRGTLLPGLSPMWVNGYELHRGGFFGDDRAISRIGNGVDVRETVGASMNDAEYQKKVQAEFKAKGAPAPGSPPVLQMASFVPAQINTGGFINEYKIPGPSNVPSDGTETKLLVGKFNTESKLEVHIHPQQSTDAFIVIRSKLKGDAPLLPGQVALFRDDAYIGQSSLPLLRPGEETDLSFGIDDQVSVKRKTLTDERKQAGVISKDNILERGYVTELQNLHKTPIDIGTKETTPASQNEKVKLDLDLDKTTAGYKTDADNIKGLLEWDFTMQPKEKKSVNLDWQLSWPSDYAISGI